MSFAEAAARLQEAVFGRLGEDATWTGVAGTVRVRRRENDDEARFDEGVSVIMVRAIKVRRSEVPSPAEGQSVQILDADGDPVSGALYQVTGEPLLDRKGVRTCPVSLA